MHYLYDTHIHTSPVSLCGQASVEETVRFYKKIGYDGIFITNHFIDHGIGCPPEFSLEEKINFYFDAIDEGKRIGNEIGIKVFGGIEMTEETADFLVFGVTREWFLSHPETVFMPKKELLPIFRENGFLVIQAHPYREAGYIQRILLYPRDVDGAEILNAGNKREYDELAGHYVQHYGLLPFAGSDNHRAGKNTWLAGLKTQTPVESVEDFIQIVKNGKYSTFLMPNLMLEE